MRAVRVPRPGDSSVLEVVELPTPKPGEDEVLIELEASGVNFLDIQQRLQRYPAGITFPYLAGVEGAGRIAALGPGIDDLAIGERVARSTACSAVMRKRSRRRASAWSGFPMPSMPAPPPRP